eukprot:2093902-Prymnesium_polylepis.1
MNLQATCTNSRMNTYCEGVSRVGLMTSCCVRLWLLVICGECAFGKRTVAGKRRGTSAVNVRTCGQSSSLPRPYGAAAHRCARLRQRRPALAPSAAWLVV